MTFDEYDRQVMTTAIAPRETFPYVGLALTEEAGEVAGKLKKLMRDDKIERFDQIPEEKRRALLLELGDVLWYTSYAAQCMGFSLYDVAEANIEKLRSRKERGAIKGSGDNR